MSQRVALDIRPAPPTVDRALPKGIANFVTAFYLFSFLAILFLGINSVFIYRYVRAQNTLDQSLADSRSASAQLKAQTAALERQAALAGQLGEWVSLSPPAQGLALLILQQVEPNVSFTRLSLEMEQGQPSVRLSLDLNAVNQDAASRQVATVQSAVQSAGMRTINVEADQPTPEGRRFIARIALPPKGDFSKVHPAS